MVENSVFLPGQEPLRWSRFNIQDPELRTHEGRPVIAWAAEQTGGLGIFVCSLVGLDRQAATESFADYLAGTRFSVDQVRFVTLIVDELTANGVMEPARLFESLFTDHAPTGPDYFFPSGDVDVIVEILTDVRGTAIPTEVA